MKKKSKHRKLKIALIAVLTVIVFAVALLCAGYYLFLDPYRQTVDGFNDGLSPDTVITGQQAADELDFIYDKVSGRHPAWLENTEKAQLTDDEYAKQREALSGRESVTVCELWKSAATMLAVLGDGHTGVNLYYQDSRVIDGFYNLPDLTLTAIDGADTDELFDRFKKVFSYEEQMEFYAKSVFDSRILYEKYLMLMDIDTSDGVDFTFEDGSTQHYGFVTADSLNGAPDESEPYKPYSYEFYEGSSLGVFVMNECTTGQEYDDMLWSFFLKVKEKGIKNVAVDLRNNGGGNSQVINEFFRYLDIDEYRVSGGLDIRIGPFIIHIDSTLYENKRRENVFDGNLYVLTSNQTFSSAMMFAMAVKDCGIGTVVGEACGNMPSSYSDVLLFQTPVTGLGVTVSHKHFYRIDTAASDEPITPDFEVKQDEALTELMDNIIGKENS